MRGVRNDLIQWVCAMAEQSHEEWLQHQQEKKEQAQGLAAGLGVGLGCFGYAILPIVVVVVLIGLVWVLGIFRGC